ncbi:MAG: hypothetical protein M0036_20705 [Desulfobacteraceae bacterium]|nr:hypothetical protein [Desulfobacteraceae bacterium]
MSAADFDKNLVADYLEEYRGLFEGYIELRGIDPAEADLIIDGVRSGENGGAAC